MIILFQNILFWKEFLACNGCFGLFSKIIKGSGTSFWCAFSAWFSHKNVPYLILYKLTKFQYHTFFPSQDIKRIVLLSSYFYKWRRHNFKMYSQSWSKATVDRERKNERRKYKNLNILKTKRALKMNKKAFFIIV